MIRFGLCCLFREQPIRFRQTTAAGLAKFTRKEQLEKLSGLCTENLKTLLEALRWCNNNEIGAFRVISPLFPRFTHPDVGYRLEDLHEYETIFSLCKEIKQFQENNHIRMSLHPDQFNVLSSPHEHVVNNTIRELEYQGMLAELIGVEVINIHGGGAYGSKKDALARFQTNFTRLSNRVTSRLTVENDDRVYTPADLVPLCKALGIPLVYDVHHHRCLTDGYTTEEATEHCVRSWLRCGREPYFHLSSPKNGWQEGNTRLHADFIDPADFPACWHALNATVDVEAKAKELAVLQLREHFNSYLDDSKQAV